MITTSGHETNRRSSRRCRNKTVAHRDRINPRYDSASTTCVTIHRNIEDTSAAICLVSVFLIRRCQTCLPPAQSRRGGSGMAPCAFPEERLHSAKQKRHFAFRNLRVTSPLTRLCSRTVRKTMTREWGQGNEERKGGWQGDAKKKYRRIPNTECRMMKERELMDRFCLTAHRTTADTQPLAL